MPTTRELVEIPEGLEARVDAFRREEIDLSDDAPTSDMARGRQIIEDVTRAVEGLSGRHGMPRLLSGEAFRAGSFGRRTQAQPLDDVDIFFPFDAAALEMRGPDGVPTAETLVWRDAKDALGCDQALRPNEWLDSRTVLDRAVGALGEISLPGVSGVGKNARGRCAHLTYLGVNVDLVFVLWAKHPRMDRYLLPEGGSWHWKASNPKDDQARLTEANQTHDGNLLPVIRCLKAWNDHACGGRLKSVHLEVLVTQTVFGTASGVTIDSRTAAIVWALGQLPDALRSRCEDPTGLGPDLDANLHPDDRDWVVARATEAAARLTAAFREHHGDPDAAFGVVRRVLMDEGSSAPKRDREAAEPRHTGEFGQPAADCADGDRERWRSVGAVPAARREDRPPKVANQTDRPDDYG